LINETDADILYSTNVSDVLHAFWSYAYFG
jgi:hypothetical protein